MKRSLLILLVFIFSAAVVAAADKTPAAGQGKKNADFEKEQVTLRVPFFSERFSGFPVAIVNGDPITLESLRQVVGSSHTSVNIEEEKASAKIDFSDALRRLINVKLIVQEGRNIGLDELPESKEAVETFSKNTMRTMLQEKHIGKIVPDEAEVDKLYKESIKEYKMKIAMFENAEAADRLQKALKAGGGFDELADKAFADKQAQTKEYEYMKIKDMLPQIAEAVSKMKVGSVSPMIKLDEGKKVRRVMIKLEDIRSVEGPEAREQVRQQVISGMRFQALVKYNSALSKKYVKLDEKVFNSIDYGSAKKTLEDWLKDQRVLATIKGDKPLTVGEFTEDIQKKYYHGLEAKKARKSVTKVKMIETFESAVGKRILLLEAKKEEIDKTPEFKEKVREYEDSVVFELFIQKVVVPDSKQKEEDVKAYYNEHIMDYTRPEKMQLSSLVFTGKKDAESALGKLQKGDDFAWVKANAEGQVTDTSTEDPLKFDEAEIFVTDLPVDLQKILTDAKAGAHVIYAATDHYYVVFVQDVIPPQAQPYEQVREVIAKKLFAEKIDKMVEDWAEKLRASSEVKVYLSDSK